MDKQHIFMRAGRIIGLIVTICMAGLLIITQALSSSNAAYLPVNNANVKGFFAEYTAPLPEECRIERIECSYTDDIGYEASVFVRVPASVFEASLKDHSRERRYSQIEYDGNDVTFCIGVSGGEELGALKHSYGNDNTALFIIAATALLLLVCVSILFPYKKVFKNKRVRSVVCRSAGLVWTLFDIYMAYKLFASQTTLRGMNIPAAVFIALAVIGAILWVLPYKKRLKA